MAARAKLDNRSCRGGVRQRDFTTLVLLGVASAALGYEPRRQADAVVGVAEPEGPDHLPRRRV